MVMGTGLGTTPLKFKHHIIYSTCHYMLFYIYAAYGAPKTEELT